MVIDEHVRKATVYPDLHDEVDSYDDFTLGILPLELLHNKYI